MASDRTVPDSPVDFPDSSSMGAGFFQSLSVRFSIDDLNRATWLLWYASVLMVVFLVGGWIGYNANPGKVLSDELTRDAHRQYDDARRRSSMPPIEGSTGRSTTPKTNP